MGEVGGAVFCHVRQGPPISRGWGRTGLIGSHSRKWEGDGLEKTVLFPSSTSGPAEVHGHLQAQFASHMTSIGASAAGVTQAASEAVPRRTEVVPSTCSLQKATYKSLKRMTVCVNNPRIIINESRHFLIFI